MWEQQADIPHSHFTQQPPSSPSASSSNISTNSQIPTQQQHRHALLSKLISQQKQLISNLKFVSYIIKQNMSYFKPQHEAQLFIHYQNLIPLHYSFYQQLNKVVEQQMVQTIYLIEEFKKHFELVKVNYKEYFCNLQNIRQIFKEICQNNKQQVKQIFANIQKTIDDYLKFPALHLLKYTQFLQLYLKSLQTQQNYQKNPIYYQLLDFYKAYKQHIINNNLNFLNQGLIKSSTQIKNHKILSKFDIQYNGNSMLMRIIQNQNQDVKYEGNKNIEKFRMEIKEDFCFVKFQDMIYNTNRVGLDNNNNFYMVTFRKQQDMANFQHFIKMQNKQIKFNLIQQVYQYQAQIYELPITFQILGQYQRIFQAHKYIIKLTLHSKNIHQFLFLSQAQIQNIFNRLKNNKIIKLSFDNLSSSQITLLKKQGQVNQDKVIQIQNKLNFMVRNNKVRQHCQYLFEWLGITEGIWQLLQEQGNKKINMQMQKKSKKCQKITYIIIEISIVISKKPLIITKYRMPTLLN